MVPGAETGSQGEDAGPAELTRRPRVIVYVTREHPLTGADQLLVIEQDGELRVPAGEGDLSRVVRDATGLEDVRVHRRLADGFVHVAATGASPEGWEHRGGRTRWEQVRADLPLWPPHAARLHDLIRKRVVAYVTRERSSRAELLTIEHRDLPDLGLQVPAGRIDAHESLEAGLYREVEEETGLGDVRIVGKLADADEFERLYGPGAHRSWAFHAGAEADGPDEWEHAVTGTGMDASLVYVCRWLPLESRPPLWGKHDPLAEELLRSITRK